MNKKQLRIIIGSEGQVRWFVICRELVVPVPMIHDPKKGIIPVFYP